MPTDVIKLYLSIFEMSKSEVYDIASQYPQIPDAIINAKPSAGLWKGQTDEEELGINYTQLEQYLRLYEEHGAGWVPNRDGKGQQVLDMIKATKHKRQTPPYFKR